MMDHIWLWYSPTVAIACILYAWTVLAKNNKRKSPVREVKQPESKGFKTGKFGVPEHHLEDPELVALKDLFFKLHNLEEYHGDVLPKAATTLQDFVAEALESGISAGATGIIAIETYSRKALGEFLEEQHHACMHSWEAYNIRRRKGGSREILADRESAAQTIRRLAPLKLVDGAWLSYISKASTPINQQHAIQQAWQIFSEELGDGDLRKNHVCIYKKLIEQTSQACPEPHSHAFTSPQQGMMDIRIWKAAVAQLLISLFPERFMAEALGFNLHFEGVAVETLIMAKELEELGCDPMYFLLHVSIDNNHSGHSAIALEAIVSYLDAEKGKFGAEGVRIAWNRIRAGYILSEYLIAATERSGAHSAPRLNALESSVIQIMNAKAPTARRMHCASRVKIGKYPVGHWLEKDRLSEPSTRKQFLRALANTSYLVRRGRSAESKLVKDMSWGGKMFGSFMDSGIAAVKAWIDALPQRRDAAYWTFIGQAPEATPYDPRTEPNCWASDFYADTPLLAHALSQVRLYGTETLPSVAQVKAPAPLPCFPNLSKLVPLWFASLHLLEGFISVPSKAANTRGSCILRVLRAQRGLGLEHSDVGGLDEALRTDRIGLFEVGLRLADKAGLITAKDIEGGYAVRTLLEQSGAEVAREMVALAARPDEHADMLIGLSYALVELHRLVMPFIDAEMRCQVERIVAKEREGLEEWMRLGVGGTADSDGVLRAHKVGKRLVGECFDD